MHTSDDDREVELLDEFDILPDQTRDDTDAGWGEAHDRSTRRADDQRLLDDRPPHWE